MRLVLAKAFGPRRGRTQTLLAIAAATLSLTACGSVTDLGGQFCFDTCGSGIPTTSPKQPSYAIVGFPYQRVTTNPADSALGFPLIGQLAPGDSVTFYLQRTDTTSRVDTVRVLSWGVSDTTIVRITAGTRGSGVLVAKAAGHFGVGAALDPAMYNMFQASVESCYPNNTCKQLGALWVGAPQAP